jgi:HK97 family phage prohead protease
MERRFTKVPVELRARSEKRSIGGYASVFNRQSHNLGGFVEVVDPAAFNASRGDGWPDVVARYNHDDNMLLGSTGGGTLRLRIDGTGLDYEVEPPAARSDILELVQRGDVRKSSFAFRTIEDEWGTTDQGFPLRRLVQVQLVDVAPVNTPAYPDATAGLRSLAEHVGASLDEVRSLAQQDELRKFFRRTSDGAPVKQTFGAAARMALLARKADPYI